VNPALPARDPGRCVTYRRVSSVDQRDRGYGLDDQAATIADFVAREGLAAVGHFADPGVSGTTPLEGRPGLSDALDTALREGAGVLVVARHDRLARDTLQALLIEKAFADAGVKIAYVEGGNGESEADRFMRNVMHSMAEMQKRELVRRLRAGAEKKREHDARAYVGGRPPLGYRADASRELVIDPEGAAIVREVFGRARRGESVARITRGLNEREASGRRWHPTSVRRVLTNDIYKRARPGRIVDAKVWNAAQTALAARRKGDHERGPKVRERAKRP